VSTFGQVYLPPASCDTDELDQNPGVLRGPRPVRSANPDEVSVRAARRPVPSPVGPAQFPFPRTAGLTAAAGGAGRATSPTFRRPVASTRLHQTAAAAAELDSRPRRLPHSATVSAQEPTSRSYGFPTCDSAMVSSDDGAAR